MLAVDWQIHRKSAPLAKTNLTEHYFVKEQLKVSLIKW